MILVLFGTNPYSFDRLAKAVNLLVRQYPAEEFVAQVGSTTFEMPGVRSEKYFEREELKRLIKAADIVITQGGFGSIADCLMLQKKVIAVPRDKTLGECQDEGGQFELVRKLEQAGRLVGAYDTSSFQEVYKRAVDFKPAGGLDSCIPQMVYQYVVEELGT